MKFSIFNFQFSNRGFTLVETLVGISIFTVSILALFAVLSQGIVNTNYAKKKMIAAYLAQEGIEYARNKRDNEVLYGNGNVDARWNRFKNDPNINNITPPSPSDTSFTRTISKTIVSSDEVKIFSKVEWTQGSGTYNITFSENLFNWIE